GRQSLSVRKQHTSLHGVGYPRRGVSGTERVAMLDCRRRREPITVHRTPFKNLVPPPPTLRLTERAALLIVDFQVFAAARSVGLGRLAAERGLDDELEEYYEQFGFARRNARDLLTAFRARGLPVFYSRRLAPAGTAPPWVPTTDDTTASVVPELAPLPGDVVGTRATTSPLAGRALAAPMTATQRPALRVAAPS